MPAEGLAPWLQTQLATLYEQSSNHEFKSPFSLHAELWSNHEKVAADTFMNQLRGGGQVFASRSIEWLNVYETSEGEFANTTDGQSQHSEITDHGSHPHGGIVSGVFVVTALSKFRIRAAPAQMQTFVTFSAKISPEREIVHFFQTSISKPVPINLSPIPPPL